MEYNKQLIEKIFFEEIIPETRKGTIEIPVFYKYSNAEEMSTFNISLTVNEPESEFNLNIQNKERLIDLLFEFVKLQLLKNSDDKTSILNKIKLYLTLVWSNVTYEDLNNPEKYLQKYINYENNKLFEDTVFASQIQELNNSDIIINIKNQSLNYETPYLFNAIIKNEDSEYYLPSISYGISDNCCYIYAIQSKKVFSNDINFEKKIKRLLYKLNDGVIANETNEYLEYKNGNEYYPENISDISPSVLISLTCFMNLLYEKGINKIKVVPFLPIRYKNKEDYYKKVFISKSKNIENKEELLQSLQNEHLRIQQNLTEKLIRDFRRMDYHFENIQILSLPMEVDEYMSLNIDEFNNSNNNLLNSLLNKHNEILINKSK